MENKNPCSPTLKAARSALLLRKNGGNIVCRGRRDQVSFLEEGHSTTLFLYRRSEKHCEEGAALRLATIMTHSLSPRIFNKQQQETLKEALKEFKRSLYGE